MDYFWVTLGVLIFGVLYRVVKWVTPRGFNIGKCNFI